MLGQNLGFKFSYTGSERPEEEAGAPARAHVPSDRAAAEQPLHPPGQRVAGIPGRCHAATAYESSSAAVALLSFHPLGA